MQIPCWHNSFLRSRATTLSGDLAERSTGPIEVGRSSRPRALASPLRRRESEVSQARKEEVGGWDSTRRQQARACAAARTGFRESWHILEPKRKDSVAQHAVPSATHMSGLRKLRPPCKFRSLLSRRRAGAAECRSASRAGVVGFHYPRLPPRQVSCPQTAAEACSRTRRARIRRRSRVRWPAVSFLRHLLVVKQNTSRLGR